jgi:O-Antigen ligase
MTTQKMKITEKQFAYISTACTCALLFIWVLPNTIALRHILLVLGALSGLELIKENWKYFNFYVLRIVPLSIVALLFSWVLIHYFFFSLNGEMELSEIKSLWFRTFLGLLMAIGLAISLHKFPYLRKYFFVSVFFVPMINVAAYGYDCYLKGYIVKPNDFVHFLFAKIETAFFGAIAGAIAVGNLVFLLFFSSEKHKASSIFLWLLGLALILVSALVSSTKNGIAVALGLCTFLGIAFTIHFLLNKGKSKIISALAVGFIVAISFGVWKSHSSLAYRGWNTVLEDASLGIDIDNNKQWQMAEGTVPTPLNSSGQQAATNTYIRFAYAAAGIRLINNYPTGYGSINNSFCGLLDLVQVPHEHSRQAHSGWIDFGMAFGIPGLILLFIVLILTISFAVANPTLLNICGGMICLTLIPFGLIAEISYKQYFEATIFFIVLATGWVYLEKSRKYL